jgi:uncharacterized membrane protein YdjX (TVP38/TMEM64 family)
MNQTTSTATDNMWRSPATRRAFVLVALVAGLALVASSAELHAWVTGFLPAAEALITVRPLLGASVFVLFAALAAMLAFVSSAVLVPVGVYVWGTALTMLLLWTGWILGGVCAYTISRYFGRAIVTRVVPEPTLAQYEHRVSHRAGFALVLLFQIALPSEVPGYLLGLVRYPFWKYLGALALAELPYAVATVYLGAGFIERRTAMLVGVGTAIAVFSGLALYALHREIAATRP